MKEVQSDVFTNQANSQKYTGITYDQLDCQGFVEQVLKDCGVRKKVMGHPIIGEVVIPCGELHFSGREQSNSADRFMEKSPWEHGCLLSRMMVESVKEAIMTTKEMQAMLEYYASIHQTPKIVCETALNLEQGTVSVTVHLTPSLMLDCPI